MTKKIFLFCLCAFSFAMTLAQPQMPNVQIGEQKKGFGFLMAHHSRILAENAGEYIVATFGTRILLAAISSDLQVVAGDSNMNILRKITIPDTRNASLLHASYVDGNVYLLYSFTNTSIYYRAEIDTRTMALVSCGKVWNNTPRDDEKVYRWTAQSDNRLFNLLAEVSMNRVTNAPQYHQVLFDNRLEILWEKRLETPMVSDVMVDDDGIGYIFGAAYDEKERENIVIVHQLDVDDESTTAEILPVEEECRLKLLNVIDGKAVAAGYVRSAQSPAEKNYYDRMRGLSLDLRSGNVKSQVLSFSSDELNVLENKGIAKEHKSGKVDALAMINTTDSTYNPDQHVIHTFGSPALAVDTNGSILWHKPFRTVTVEGTTANFDIFRGTSTLISEGDDVYLILPDNSQTTATYDISSQVDVVKLGMLQSETRRQSCKSGHCRFLRSRYA